MQSLQQLNMCYSSYVCTCGNDIQFQMQFKRCTLVPSGSAVGASSPQSQFRSAATRSYRSADCIRVRHELDELRCIPRNRSVSFSVFPWWVHASTPEAQAKKSHWWSRVSTIESTFWLLRRQFDFLSKHFFILATLRGLSKREGPVFNRGVLIRVRLIPFKFPHKVALVKCPCAFRLRKLG